jgi:hypothetical protein
VNFFFVWLGAPFGHIEPRIEVSRDVGFVLVALFVAVSTHILVSYRLAARSRSVHLWLILGSFVLFTGASITVGRGGFGLPGALPSRYHSFSLMFTPVLFVLMLIWGNLMSERHGERRVRAIWPAIGFVTGAGALLFGMSSMSGWADAREYAKMRKHLHLVVSLVDVIPDNPLLGLVHVNAGRVVDISRRLRSSNLPHVVLPAAKILPLLQLRTAGLDWSRGSLDRVVPYEKDRLMVTGWAVTNKKARPADAVILVWRDVQGRVKPLSVLPIDTKRPDVAATFKNDALLESGFNSWIYRNNIPGPGKISAWALYTKSQDVYPLAGAFDVP